MQLSKYDRFVWRVNGTAILLICVLGLTVGSLLSYKLIKEAFVGHYVSNIVNTDPKKKNEDFFNLGHFQVLKNTDYILIPLNSSEKIDLSRSSYKSSNQNTRNYLLFNEKTKKSHWIWENNERLILKEERITQGKKESKRALGLVFESVETDSNNDGRLSSNDIRSVEFFDLSDFTRVQVLRNINRILGLKQTLNNEVLIFFLESEKSYVATFDTIKKKVIYKSVIQLPH